MNEPGRCRGSGRGRLFDAVCARHAATGPPVRLSMGATRFNPKRWRFAGQNRPSLAIPIGAFALGSQAHGPPGACGNPCANDRQRPRTRGGLVRVRQIPAPRPAGSWGPAAAPAPCRSAALDASALPEKGCQRDDPRPSPMIRGPRGRFGRARRTFWASKGLDGVVRRDRRIFPLYPDQRGERRAAWARAVMSEARRVVRACPKAHGKICCDVLFRRRRCSPRCWPSDFSYAPFRATRRCCAGVARSETRPPATPPDELNRNPAATGKKSL